ncbi:GrpB family protein [Clostridium sp. D2Q-11]|uniref:GrpB family protein n=1 Tax=Anaeromonas frigoriresistens TaxID=2683708 RepID=A0A942Z7X7_9FIRM|nr:GrpB family protein [Anaeromonas frigoriresistens]MBS4537713.1 GrpB family protein [Anaeromonas frigoriresistens]
MIGLPRGKVKLSPYSKEWSILFEKEKDELIKSIGKFIIDIQHVGSTSIPHMDSKPIIDIVIGIKELKDGLQCMKPLEKLGYHYKGHMGKSNRLFFAKGNEDNRTHHVNIVEYGDKNWTNLILFRDYLIKHQDFKHEYEVLKKRLAREYGDDRNTYTCKKEDFILNTIELAMVEKGHKKNN